MSYVYTMLSRFPWSSACGLKMASPHLLKFTSRLTLGVLCLLVSNVGIVQASETRGAVSLALSMEGGDVSPFNRNITIISIGSACHG